MTKAAHKDLQGRGRPRGAVQPKLRDANAVPPPQYDRMGAPVWQPTPGPAPRPGAEDHKRYASRGYRC